MFFPGDVGERPVVEDVAVLVDLDERRALVLVGLAEHGLHVLAIHVVGTGDEAGLGPDRDRNRIEGVVERSERRTLGHLAHFARRRVLALGESVDLVVEQQDREVDVATQRMNEVIPSDRQPVAIAGHHPDVEVRPRRARRRSRPMARARECCESRRCSCNTGIGWSTRCRRRRPGSPGGHRVRASATGAPSAPSSRHSPDTSALPGRTRSPCGSGSPAQPSIISRILVSISAARKGRPATLVRLCASTRYSARTNRDS